MKEDYMYQNQFTERFLVIAEKPSIARTIAQVLACEDKRDGYLEGPDGVISWCFGHLAEYAMRRLMTSTTGNGHWRLFRSFPADRSWK